MTIVTINELAEFALIFLWLMFFPRSGGHHNNMTAVIWRCIRLYYGSYRQPSVFKKPWLYSVSVFTGIAKVFVLWYKIDVFGLLLNELAEIWPMPPLDDEYQAIKDKSLSALSLAHRCK